MQLPMVVEDLTPEWLTSALSVGSPGTVVARAEVEQVIWGTATKVLLRLTYAARPADGPPERVCVKGGFDPALLELGLAAAYASEVHFYATAAPELDIPTARCWFAGTSAEQRQGILVLDDLAAAGYTFGEPTEPWQADQVAVGLELLARLHVATEGTARQRYPWLAPTSPVRQVADLFFTAEYWDQHFGGPDGPPVPESLLDRQAVAAAFRQLWQLEDKAAQAVSHGDPHIGNAYLDPHGRPAFLDWQGVCAAPPMDDVAYLIVGALTPADRRDHERALLAQYRDAVLTAGGQVADQDELWLDYRRHHLHGFLWSLTGPKMQPRERVFAMSERHVAAIEDHETLAALRT